MKMIYVLLFASITLLSCGKENGEPKPVEEPIDVSSQQYVDYMGNYLSRTGTGPTNGFVFNETEKALFKSLDTANLAGTSGMITPINLDVFPNPFRQGEGIRVIHQFPTGYPVDIVAKYVITDSLLNPVFKITGSVKNTLVLTDLMPMIPTDKYRLYMTLSVQGNNNYFTRWINIERVN